MFYYLSSYSLILCFRVLLLNILLTWCFYYCESDDLSVSLYVKEQWLFLLLLDSCIIVFLAYWRKLKYGFLIRPFFIFFLKRFFFKKNFDADILISWDGTEKVWLCASFFDFIVGWIFSRSCMLCLFCYALWRQTRFYASGPM